MKKAFAFIISILWINVIQAQIIGSTIHGQLKDATTGENLINVTLKLIRAKDSVILKQKIENKNGFVISKIPGGKYFLQLSYIGYRDTAYFVTIGAHDSIYNAGILTMTKFSSTLMEVIVKATIPPVITKNDTIIYNTSAFKTRANATVEELLKKLPGIEVDKEGNITFQGEKIQKIYIDGKDFFLTDPKLTTQNFLADMVQKVEAFDDKSERAKLTGIPDDKPGKALNLRLKPDNKKGYFGKMTAGYASYNRYNINASTNYLKDDAMAIISAGCNNSGSGRIGNQTKNISLNYRNTLNQNLLYSISHGYNANKSRNSSFNQRQTFIADSSLLQEREGTFAADGSSHSINVNVNYKIDSFSNLSITATTGLKNATNNTSDDANTYIAKVGNVQPVNSAITNNNTNDNSWNGNINVNYNRRSRKQGRYFGLIINSGRNQRSGDGGLSSLTKFYDPFGTLVDSLERNQRFHQNTDAFTYGLNISYTEPVGKNQILDFYYNLNNSNNNSNKTAYNYNPITGKYDQPDSIASNGFENTNRMQSFGIGYNNFRSNKFRYQVGIGMTKGRQQNINKTANFADLAQKTTNIFPRASLLYSISKHQTIRLAYSGNNRQPFISELQPLPDFSNPLIIHLGNPSLKPEFSNQVNLEYRGFNTQKMRSFTANVNYRNTLNRIINSVVTNAQGIQEQQYVNMNGDYSFGGSVNYSMPLVKLQKPLSIMYNASISFSRDANIVNRELNIQHSAITSQGLAFNYHLGKKLFTSASGNFNFSSTKYSIQTTGKNNIISHHYNGNISYEFLGQLVIYTDFNIIFNNTQRNLNVQNSMIWNASIMKRMFKDKKGELKLSIFDILNDKKDFTHTIGDNYIETTRTEVVKRIFNLSFIYRFRGNKL